MQLEQLYFIAEIVAALAVVISLIYLALQVKHARLQNRSAAMDVIAKQRADFVNVLALDNEVSKIVAVGLSGNRMSDLEYYRFGNYLYSVCVNLEIAFVKYTNSEISAETWRAWDEGCKSFFMCPGFQKWWQHNHVGGFTQSFKDHINVCITQCNANLNEGQKKMLEFLNRIGHEVTPAEGEV